MKPTKSGRTFCKIISLALLALCITLFIACGKNLLVIDFLDGKRSKPLPEVTVTAPKFAAVAEVYTQPAAQKIIIENNGKSKVTVKSVTVSPDTAFTVGGGGSTVSARSSIDTWTVQPKAALPQGDHMAIITVTCSGTGGSAAANAVVTFTVTRSGGAVLSVTAPTFADVVEGYTSTTRPAAGNITIANTGSAAATIPSGGVTVSDTAKFEIAGGSSPVYTVDAGSSITSWTVQPKDGLAAGTHMAIITVTYNGTAANAVVTFTVTKPGAAILSVTAPTFSNAVEGYTTTTSSPAAGEITITNNGVSRATINSVTVSPNTVFTISGSGGTVDTGLSIDTWTVQPASGLARGTHMAIITVMYNGGITASAVVTFTVVQPGAANLSVTAPTFRDEEEGYTATQPVVGKITITNNGNAAATITSVTVTGSSFEISGSGPAVSVGDSINTYTVQPKLSLARGTHMAIITVTYSSTGGTATASAVVTFTVTQPAQTRALTVIAPAFDDVYTGYSRPSARSIIITNTGNAMVTIKSVTIDDTANFTLVAGSYTVGAGNSIANWTVRPNAGRAAGGYYPSVLVEYYDTHDTSGSGSTTTVGNKVDFTVMARTRFVAVAYSSDKAIYSADGSDWREAKMPSSTGWYSVTYGAGRYVAIAYSSNTAAYSFDGINWSAATLPTLSAGNWVSVTYGNGMFVAVADGSKVTAYSTNGINWIAPAVSGLAGTNWKSVTYGGGKFVAVGNSTTTACSTDGIDWSESSGALPLKDWSSVTYGSGKFVALAFDSTAAHSDDGTTWYPATQSPTVGKCYSVTYGGGRFVTVSYAGNSTVAYSIDGGVNWTTENSLAGVAWRPVAYGNGKFATLQWDGQNFADIGDDTASWTAAAGNRWHQGAGMGAAGIAKWVSIAYGTVEIR